MMCFSAALQLTDGLWVWLNILPSPFKYELYHIPPPLLLGWSMKQATPIHLVPPEAVKVFYGSQPAQRIVSFTELSRLLWVPWWVSFPSSSYLSASSLHYLYPSSIIFANVSCIWQHVECWKSHLILSHFSEPVFPLRRLLHLCRQLGFLIRLSW